MPKKTSSKITNYFASLSYKELQTECKSRGLRANGSSDVLKQRLDTYQAPVEIKKPISKTKKPISKTKKPPQTKKKKTPSTPPAKLTVKPQEEKALRDELVCPVCLEVFCLPIETNCGHAYCAECFLSFWKEHMNQQEELLIEQRPKCPTCRGQITSVLASIALRKVISVLSPEATNKNNNPIHTQQVESKIVDINKKLHNQISPDRQIPFPLSPLNLLGAIMSSHMPMMRPPDFAMNPGISISLSDSEDSDESDEEAFFCSDCGSFH